MSRAARSAETQRSPKVREHGRRRALSHVGGPTRVTGTSEDSAIARWALAVRADDPATRAHVHGFHSYPARLHPVTAARLVEALSRPGERVLDPFCGSGTTLVEARRTGRLALGSDLNPLAVELSWLKTLAPDAVVWRRVAEAGNEVAALADQRRAARAGPTRRYSAEDMELFDIHVLLELDSLRSGIAGHDSGFIARCLGLVLSSLLTKLSRQAGDASEKRLSKRLAAGFATTMFRRKLEELGRRLATFNRLIPAGAPPAQIALCDARRLPHVRDRSVALALSSPPYPGVYDYAEQHAARLRWLGLDARRLAEREIGARRRIGRSSAGNARAQFEADLDPCLVELARVVRPNGAVALVLGDGLAGGRPLAAAEVIRTLAASRGMKLTAQASQARPHVHPAARRAFGGAPREEHLFLLRHA